MKNQMNVAPATTNNSGKSVNNNNVENTNSQMAKMESVEVRSQKTWEQLMHTENVEAYMGIDDEVKNRITYECPKWSCEQMKKMAKRRNVKSYRILKPNGEETNSFVRANGTNLAVIEYVDGRESIYIKLYNENADDLWWYLVEEKDLVGFYIVEKKTDEKETDYSAVIDAIENWDAAKSEMAEIMCEVNASEDYYNDKDLQERKYNAESVLIRAAKDVEFEVEQLGNPTYLIGNRGDYDMMAIWVIGKYIVTKEIDVDEYDKYRCSVLPKFMSEIDELVRESLPTEQLMSDEEFVLGDEDELKSFCVGLVF